MYEIPLRKTNSVYGTYTLSSKYDRKNWFYIIIYNLM